MSILRFTGFMCENASEPPTDSREPRSIRSSDIRPRIVPCPTAFSGHKPKHPVSLANKPCLYADQGLLRRAAYMLKELAGHRRVDHLHESLDRFPVVGEVEEPGNFPWPRLFVRGDGDVGSRFTLRAAARFFVASTAMSRVRTWAADAMASSGWMCNSYCSLVRPASRLAALANDEGARWRMQIRERAVEIWDGSCEAWAVA